MKRIRFVKPDMPLLDEIAAPLQEILASGMVTNFGKYVRLFEQRASDYLGVEALTVASGTTGLVLALQALGLRRDQKVVLPSFTFVATAQAVLYAGGVPVFADVGPDLTLSPSDLALLLDQYDDVRAVLPVHTFGLPCAITEIARVVEQVAQRSSRPIAILYDAAHAFGSAVEGARVGGFGDAEVFSLSATKVLTSIEGGLIASRDVELMAKIREMRNYGLNKEHDSTMPGLNGKMSEAHAIVGLHNLGRLDSLLAKRARKARYYRERLEISTPLRTIPCPADVTHTFKELVVLLPEGLAAHRHEIVRFLADRGVEARIYFWPSVHLQANFRRFARRPLPRTEAAARRVISLPFYSTISKTAIKYVVDVLAEACHRALGSPPHLN